MKLIPLVIVVAVAVILLALPPASLTHKNPQRRQGMRPVERKDRSIDRSEDVFVEYPVMWFLWLLLWLSFNEAYLF